MTPPTQQDKPIDLEALRLAAEAATPGPWEEDDGFVSAGALPACFEYVAWTGPYTGDEGDSELAVLDSNAFYIAAWSPATALALLALIDAQQKKIAALGGVAGFAADLGMPADGIGG